MNLSLWWNSDDPKVSRRQIDNKTAKEDRMRKLSKEEKAEEERYGVSTELTLYTDPWVIKKELKTSDLGRLNRLLLHRAPSENHIIKYLSEDNTTRKWCNKNMIQQGEGIKVNVYDHDTDSTFELVLKKWAKWNSYVLNNGWRKNFVIRRGLKKGDKIGLFWDRFESKLHFRVLSRAAKVN